MSSHLPGRLSTQIHCRYGIPRGALVRDPDARASACRGGDLLLKLWAGDLRNLVLTANVVNRPLSSEVPNRSCLLFQRRAFRPFMYRACLIYLLDRRFIDRSNVKILFLCRDKSSRHSNRVRHEAANVPSRASYRRQFRITGGPLNRPATFRCLGRCHRVLPRVLTIRAAGKGHLGQVANYQGALRLRASFYACGGCFHF